MLSKEHKELWAIHDRLAVLKDKAIDDIEKIGRFFEHISDKERDKFSYALESDLDNVWSRIVSASEEDWLFDMFTACNLIDEAKWIISQNPEIEEKFNEFTVKLRESH